MKFKKGAVYDALFLSDVHYLIWKKIKKHKHKELFQFLDHLHKKEVKFRSIILVGDIIENWFFDSTAKLTASRKRFNRLFDRFDRIVMQPGLKYYIVGNHDTTAFSMKLDPAVEKYLHERGWQITDKVETSDFTAIHGHQGQYNKLTWALDIAIVRTLHRLSYLFPGLLQKTEEFYNRHLNWKDPLTYERKIKYYRRLMKTAKSGNRILLSGHTHLFHAMPEISIINTGDWVHNRSFVILDKGKFTGYVQKSKKEYKKAFRLKLKNKYRDSRKRHLYGDAS